MPFVSSAVQFYCTMCLYSSCICDALIPLYSFNTIVVKTQNKTREINVY